MLYNIIHSKRKWGERDFGKADIAQRLTGHQSAFASGFFFSFFFLSVNKLYLSQPVSFLSFALPILLWFSGGREWDIVWCLAVSEGQAPTKWEKELSRVSLVYVQLSFHTATAYFHTLMCTHMYPICNPCTHHPTVYPRMLWIAKGCTTTSCICTTPEPVLGHCLEIPSTGYRGTHLLTLFIPHTTSWLEGGWIWGCCREHQGMSGLWPAPLASSSMCVQCHCQGTP